MAKILTNEQQAELRRLEARLLLTIGFFQDAEDFPSGDQMRAVVEHAALRKDVRALRLISRDLDAMALALPSFQREGLEALLEARLGVDRDTERQIEDEQVEAILARGSIASEKERRRLELYIDRVDVVGDAKHVEAVQELLRRST